MIKSILLSGLIISGFVTSTHAQMSRAIIPTYCVEMGIETTSLAVFETHGELPLLVGVDSSGNKVILTRNSETTSATIFVEINGRTCLLSDIEISDLFADQSVIKQEDNDDD